MTVIEEEYANVSCSIPKVIKEAAVVDKVNFSLTLMKAIKDGRTVKNRRKIQRNTRLSQKDLKEIAFLVAEELKKDAS